MVDWVRRLAGTTTNGDFEALVLWCQLAAQRARGSTCHAGQRPSAPVPVRLPQLVASTGVPRETARRKLELLAALGRVARVDRGWVARPEGMNTLSRAITSKDRRRLREVLAGLEADRRAT